MIQYCAATLVATAMMINSTGAVVPIPVRPDGKATSPELIQPEEEMTEEARILERDRALREGDEMAFLDVATGPERLAHYGRTEDEEDLIEPAGSGGLRVEVDVSQNVMTVTKSGEVLARWPVSTARRGHVTRKGNFRIHADPGMINHRSGRYNGSPMPHAMFYSGNYAIHGTYHTKDLGRMASAGCIRLSPGNAATLFGWVGEAGGASLSVQP